MKRIMLVSLSLVVFGWISGCGAYNSGGGGGNMQNALNGQYAILLSGFDGTGQPVAIAGSIKADGYGKIMGGEVDVNDNGTLSSSSAVTGSYSFDSQGQGVLGTITLTNTVGTLAHPLVFGFSLRTSGDFGDIMDLDGNNFIAAGTMQLQTPSVFLLSALAGNYVVTLNQRDSLDGTSVPTSAIGHITLGSGGASTNVLFDRSFSGVGSFPATSATLTFGSTDPDTNGRGTFTLAINDAHANTSQTFAYYAVATNKIIAVETDTNGTMSADFSGQMNTPFSASTVVTTGAVFEMAGVDPAQANEIAAVGQLQITGATSTGGTLHWDSNDNGVIVNIPTLASQAVTFDQASGRGTVTVTSGTADGLADSLVFYLTSPGTGFIMDATSGITNRAMTGILTNQVTATFSASTDLASLGIIRSRGASVNDAFSLVGLFGPTTTSGVYALNVDFRQPPSPFTVQPDQNISPITLVTSIDPNIGRGTLGLPGSITFPQAFYIIAPNQIVFIDITPASTGQNGPTSVFIVSPQ